ncbi:MAG: hypothetical protein ABSF55_00165 [Candidatus Staskawiczbacteria bacterium]|jgi:predicted PurR-regulated permease PerM
MKKKFIFSIIVIVIILIVVFLSQQAYFRGIGKTLISDATNQASAYTAKASNWAISTIYPKISGEVQARGDMIKNEVGQEQKNVSENIGQKISNYVSGITNSILHPGTSQNCQPAQTSSGSGQ